MLKIIFSLFLSLSIVSCGSGGLKYSRVSDFGSFLSADVQLGGKKVMWFQVFDQIEKPDSVESYKNATKKIGKYPAKISDNKWIWVLINNRFEIRLIADSKSSLYQDSKKLEEFINKFNLSGLEGVTQTTKLTAKQLRDYIPKLPMSKKRVRKKSSIFKKKSN